MREPRRSVGMPCRVAGGDGGYQPMIMRLLSGKAFLMRRAVA